MQNNDQALTEAQKIKAEQEKAEKEAVEKGLKIAERINSITSQLFAVLVKNEVSYFEWVKFIRSDFNTTVNNFCYTRQLVDFGLTKEEEEKLNQFHKEQVDGK